MLDKVSIKIVNNIIKKLPTYASDGSAGLDLHAAISSTIDLRPQETVLISTGIAIYIKDKNYAATILPRSGLGHKKGIVLGNLIGLIDSDYQGELMISCWNRSNSSYQIQPLERIAQMIFLKIEHPKFELVDDFISTERGEKGFGSSGK
ncbi:MAG: dUTP diphosphatase [Gammaproteobacteria bacterium]|jgi:dUTP pyrophosphatase|nr:dUTP diphosphatase [Gammaproteobacteria bacterium]